MASHPKIKSWTKTGTTIFAIKDSNNVVMGSDGRTCDGVYGGSISDTTVKLYWLYQNVYVGCAGDVQLITRITEEVRRRCEIEPPVAAVRVVMWIRDAATRETIDPGKTASFILIGFLRKQEIHTVRYNLKSNSYEDREVTMAVIGSGQDYVVDHVKLHKDALATLRGVGDREKTRDFIREAIQQARIHDFGTDGTINTISLSVVGRAIFESSKPKNISNREVSYGSNIDAAYNDWKADEFVPIGMNNQ